jgi:hypothetical protein
MNKPIVTCPKCGTQVEVTEAIASQVEQRLRQQFNQRYLEEKAKLEDRLKKQAEERYGPELNELKKQLEEKVNKLKLVQQQELALRERQSQLEQREQKLQEEVQQKINEQKSRLEAEIKKKAEETFALELRDLKNQIQEKSEKLREAQEKELEFRKRERELKEREQKLLEETQQKFNEQRAKLEEQVKKQTAEKFALELRDLKNQVQETSEKLKEAQAKELEFRKRERELALREQSLKLELERTLADERNKIWNQATQKIAEEHRLKDAEKDKQLADMRQQIEDLKRKAEQGSQQAQGEVLEIELENLLRTKFRYDEILPVPKGIRGADVIQHVHTQFGNFCGSILWESKRTKTWNDAWIQKLKDDQRETKANFAVIVSTALPDGIKNIGNIEGVWIVDFASVVGIAMALRAGMIDVARTKSAVVGKSEKMELVYNYLAGQEFRQRVEAIVESFVAMKEDLDAEKRAMERNWAKREKQIDRIVQNTARLYGDLQGIIGGMLQPIARLELQAGFAQGELYQQAELASPDGVSGV